MFKKYEYLLRDRYFILRTDHRNLTYLNESASPKVRRWKMLIAEFDFSIEYIKGEDNIVADAQSRLLTDARLVGDGINQVFAMSEEAGEVRWCHTRDQRETALGTKWGRRTPPDNARPCEMQTHAWEVTELLATLVEIESTTLREQLNAS